MMQTPALQTCMRPARGARSLGVDIRYASVTRPAIAITGETILLQPPPAGVGQELTWYPAPKRCLSRMEEPMQRMEPLAMIAIRSPRMSACMHTS